MGLTPDEEKRVRDMIRKETTAAVQDTFKVLGIDVNDFTHMEEFRQNQVWTSRYRRTAERVGSHVIITLTALMSSGIAMAVWSYFTKR